MKRFMKQNKFFLISIIILFLLFIKVVRTCIAEGTISSDPLIMYYHMFQDLELCYLQLLGPLFVMIPSIYIMHNDLYTGMINNILMRIDYKQYLKETYLKVFKISFLLPVFVIISLLFCCFMTNSLDFGSGKELYEWISSPDIKYIDILPIFMLTYLVVLWLHSILYINIGLIVCRKKYNFLVTVILSYIYYIILAIILESVVGNLILARILGVHNISDTLNIFNIWLYDNVTSLGLVVIYTLILILISFIVLYKGYKDKEGVIIDVEK